MSGDGVDQNFQYQPPAPINSVQEQNLAAPDLSANDSGEPDAPREGLSRLGQRLFDSAQYLAQHAAETAKAALAAAETAGNELGSSPTYGDWSSSGQQPAAVGSQRMNLSGEGGDRNFQYQRPSRSGPIQIQTDGQIGSPQETEGAVFMPQPGDQIADLPPTPPPDLSVQATNGVTFAPSDGSKSFDPQNQGLSATLRPSDLEPFTGAGSYGSGWDDNGLFGPPVPSSITSITEPDAINVPGSANDLPSLKLAAPVPAVAPNDVPGNFSIPLFPTWNQFSDQVTGLAQGAGNFVTQTAVGAANGLSRASDINGLLDLGVPPDEARAQVQAAHANDFNGKVFLPANQTQALAQPLGGFVAGVAGPEILNGTLKAIGLAGKGISSLVSEFADLNAPTAVNSLALETRAATTRNPIGNLRDVWQLPPTERGHYIESYLATTNYSEANGWYRVGAEGNGYFPLVDFQQGNTLISLKTVDTTGSTWLGRMEGEVDKLATTDATVNGQPVNMVLDLRVQPGGVADAYPLIAHAENNYNNVTVTVKEFGQ